MRGMISALVILAGVAVVRPAQAAAAAPLGGSAVLRTPVELIQYEHRDHRPYYRRPQAEWRRRAEMRRRFEMHRRMEMRRRAEMHRRAMFHRREEHH